MSSILVLVLQTQYILIKACHSRSNEYIYCNVSIFRRWIWLRNCLCHRGPDSISLKISFFPGEEQFVLFTQLSLRLCLPKRLQNNVYCNIQTRKVSKDKYGHLAQKSLCTYTGLSYFFQLPPPFFFLWHSFRGGLLITFGKIKKLLSAVMLLLAYERTLIKQTMNCPIHTVKKRKKTPTRAGFNWPFTCAYFCSGGWGPWRRRVVVLMCLQLMLWLMLKFLLLMSSLNHKYFYCHANALLCSAVIHECIKKWIWHLQEKEKWSKTP